MLDVAVWVAVGWDMGEHNRWLQCHGRCGAKVCSLLLGDEEDLDRGLPTNSRPLREGGGGAFWGGWAS